jgi:hypothetical protein
MAELGIDPSSVRAHWIGNQRTLAIRNLTGSAAKRILKTGRDQQKWAPVLCPIAL